MLFQMNVPCQFPRIRIQVYDFETFGGDDSLGEVVINLKNTFKQLTQVANYEMPNQSFEFKHPNFPGADRGEVVLSMKILPKQQADQDKVGKAQEEPNKDPYLEKPTEGRGVAAFMKGSIFSYLFSSLFMNLIKIVAATLFSTIVFLILFYRPGILINDPN